MSDPIKRLHYYDQQFLRSTDFTAEQNYHLSMRRLHNQVLHTWGVVQGLTLSLAGTAVTVAPGVAMDSQGREMVLGNPTNLDLTPMPVSSNWYVTIVYGEQTSDHTTESGGAGDTRWTEQPTVSLATVLPADTSTTLLLGQITKAQDGSFSISTSSRVPAAAVTPPDITANSLTLKNSAGQPQWPRLSSTGANQAALNGSLTANGDVTCVNLTTTGNLAGAVANMTGIVTCDHVVQINPAADLKVSNSVSVGSPAVSGSKGSISASGDIRTTGIVSCDHVVQKNPAPGMQQILLGYVSASYGDGSGIGILSSDGGTGARYWDRNITFSSPFAGTPLVQASLSYLDCDCGHNLRVKLLVDTITTTGFRLRVTDWADTVLWGVGVNWIAIL